MVAAVGPHGVFLSALMGYSVLSSDRPRRLPVPSERPGRDPNSSFFEHVYKVQPVELRIYCISQTRLQSSVPDDFPLQVQVPIDPPLMPSQAARQPGKQATRQPGNQAARHDQIVVFLNR